ncbi:hypothetical protein BUALT_Bualt07G0064100 [Buddleja alternifolia]|uniref:START domain-containing protein n=1 Tax=Buddleja alternifolia TaxID=168488 RepID=A0AAV6XGP4_9LAMI|nr:hypothetical protein BUALT_Bualt07G0064100 [Buddleja alternifolia]
MVPIVGSSLESLEMKRLMDDATCLICLEEFSINGNCEGRLNKVRILSTLPMMFHIKGGKYFFVYRHPFGCFIQNMPNDHSKFTWVEHWGIEDKAPMDRLYRELIQSGLAIGAERWLSTLRRTSERFAWLDYNLGGNK